ncbi:MAG: ankyrin repeat domain-containing protein [Alistipes senegalensis]|nr:ankyrin repeat domain-containing protein [Oxalobacter formigenes]MCM1280987.1 ankyrin repeat domain-containing protein [Alistipes senegalensis]
MDAAAGLYPDTVNRLLGEGASVNARDQYGETPLMKALRQPASRSFENMRPMSETIRILLDAGADKTIVNTRGQDTLKLVLETGNINVIEQFIGGMTQTEKDVMFMRALENSQYDVALYLIQYGANPVQINKEKQSALHLAVNNVHPHLPLLQALVAANDVNLVDYYGITPIMTACANGAPVEIVSLLVENGSRIDSRFQGKNLLYLALTAPKENVELVQYLLKKGLSANETTPDGQPFIVLMARADRLRSAKALADAGADLEALDKYGEKAYRARLNILAS